MEKYTVIIPTRDRAETLEATLRTCLRQTYPNFEIVVSDNCSADNTRALVDKLNDPRIRYINPGKRLSMSGNFEYALGHVHEGFVMFIGADDGIMPDAIEYVDSIVKKYDVKAVSCRQATYVWPEFLDREIEGRLIFGGVREDVEIRESAEWLRRTLSFEAFYCFELPNLYCGFVNVDLIRKAYKDGFYFRSIVPDAYSAFATAIFVDRYAFSHRPFSIAGASSKSNGASALNRNGDDVEFSKFQTENDLEYFEGFINFPCYEIALGEAFCQVKHAFPEKCAEYHLDYERMLNNALANSNVKTRGTIENAVKIMRVNFKDKIESFHPKKVVRRKKWGDFFQKLNRLRGRGRIIGIPNSHEMKIRDINDAALVAHVLLTLPQVGRFTRVREILIDGILSFFKTKFIF